MRLRIRRRRLDRWRWGKLVVSTFKARGAFDEFGIAPVDVEVIPPFTGEPEGIAAWLIFESAKEVHDASARHRTLLDGARALLVGAGFPPHAVGSLELRFTSWPEIEAGGGRFSFFR